MIIKRFTINDVNIVIEAKNNAVDQLNLIYGVLRSIQENKFLVSKDLDVLDADFKAKVKIVLARCEQRGYIFRPYATLRSPWEQAKLWRQSRPTEEIQRAIKKLQVNGAKYLAFVLQSVGPQYGRWATNALPGQSWHNWGLAVDCFLLSADGRAIWSSSHPGYAVYSEEASRQGLTCGREWVHKDAVHIQAVSYSVKSKYTWAAIDKKMLELFP